MTSFHRMHPPALPPLFGAPPPRQGIKRDKLSDDDDNDNDIGDDDNDDNDNDSGASPAAGKPAGPSAKAPAPVKAACMFCRSRKSRCDGQQPCSTCVRKKHECVYTASRRGTKRRLIDPDVLRGHLEDLLGLSFLPHDIRVPGLVKQLRSYQQPDLSAMSLYELNTLQDAIEAQRARQRQAQLASRTNMSSALADAMPSTSTRHLAPPPSSAPAAPAAPANAPPNLRSLLTRALEELNVGGVVQSTNDNEGTCAQENLEPQEVVSLMMGPEGNSTTHEHAQPGGPSSTPDHLSSLAAQLDQQRKQQRDQHFARLQSPTKPFTPERTHQLLTGFYLSLYSFVPILLPPQYLNAYVDYYHARPSPFLLALEAILPLLSEEVEREPTTGIDGLNCPARQRRRKATSRQARQASEAIDDLLESIEEQADWGTLLEVLQALTVLAIFEHGSGRAVKARLKADQAMGLAMTHGMHRLSSYSAFEALIQPSLHAPRTAELVDRIGRAHLFDQSKRIWWSTWMLLLYASFNTGTLMSIQVDDPRVVTALPTSSLGSGAQDNEWERRLSTLRLMILVQDRMLALMQPAPPETEDPVSPHLPDSPFSPCSASSRASSRQTQLAESIRSLDQRLGAEIQAYECNPTSLQDHVAQAKATTLAQVEGALVHHQHLMIGSQMYTGWLGLHLFSAFQGAPTFEKKLCLLKCIPEDIRQGGTKSQGAHGPARSASMSSASPLQAVPAAPAPAPAPAPLPASSVAHPAPGAPLVPAPAPLADPSTYPGVFGGAPVTPVQASVATTVPSAMSYNWFQQPGHTLPHDPYPVHLQTQQFVQPFMSTGDWLLQLAGLPEPGPQHDTGMVSGQGVTPAPGAVAAAAAAAGPAHSPHWASEMLDQPAGSTMFEPSYSLERCVYASKRLLQIVGRELVTVNPWLSCELVLASYTLLSHALNLGSSELPDDSATAQAQAQVQAQAPAPPQPQPRAQTHYDEHCVKYYEYPPTSVPQARLAPAAPPAVTVELQEIWRHVRVMCDTLTLAAQHWDMVTPMAEEVQTCLATSERLFEVQGE